MLFPKTTKQFEKDKEKSRKQKRSFSTLTHVVNQLIQEKILDPKYCDHSLKGE